MANSCFEDLYGRMTLKSMVKLVPQEGKRRMNERRRAVILDFRSFTKRGLLVDHMCPADTFGDGGGGGGTKTAAVTRQERRQKKTDCPLSCRVSTMAK